MALKADGTIVCWGAGTTNTGVGAAYGPCIVPQDMGHVLGIAAAGDNTIAIVGTACSDDIEVDGDVDVSDLGLLLSAWVPCAN